MKNGKGIFRFNDGNVYQGEYLQGWEIGYGRYILKNGNIYEGYWVNGILKGNNNNNIYILKIQYY